MTPTASKRKPRWHRIVKWPESVPEVRPRALSLDGRVRALLQGSAELWDAGERREALAALARRWRGLVAVGVKRVHALLSAANNLLLPPLFTMLFVELYLGGLPAAVSAEVGWLDVLFGLAFGSEWVLGLLLARRRGWYLINLWLLIDLLSVLPVVLAQAFRSTRALRVLRLLKVANIVRARRFRIPVGRFVRALAIAGSATLAGAIALQGLEPQTVEHLEDGLWWSLVTVSTVGYGDISPVTPEGRLIAGVLIVLGLGVFSYFTGLMSATVEDPEEQAILAEVEALRGQVARMERLLERLAVSEGGQGPTTPTEPARER